jgi:hypothetical protein
MCEVEEIMEVVTGELFDGEDMFAVEGRVWVER